MSINELEAKARELMEVRKEIEELEAMKTVTGTRFDSTAFKKANPELAKAYTKETRTCRFTIN